MIFLLALFGVPIAYLAVLVTLLVRREPRGIGLSLAILAVAVTTGAWSILQSR